MTQPLVIILEGADRTGKGTFVETLRRIAKTPKLVHLHSTKPPILNVSPYTAVNSQNYKDWSNKHYSNVVNNINTLIKTNDIIILDRSYLGEYVYGPLYRFTNYTKTEMRNFELDNPLPRNTVLVYLTDSAENLIARDDGKSHTDDLNNKVKELKLFKTVIDNSIISNKLIIDWSTEDFTPEVLESYINYILSLNKETNYDYQ